MLRIACVSALAAFAVASPVRDHIATPAREGQQPPKTRPTRPAGGGGRPTPKPFVRPTSFTDCINQAAKKYGSQRSFRDRCQPLRRFECDESCSGPTTCCPVNSTRAGAPTMDYAWSYVCPLGWNQPPGPDGKHQCSDCKGGDWGTGCGDICAHDVMRCHAFWDCGGMKKDPSGKSSVCTDAAKPYCQPSDNSVNVAGTEPHCFADKPTRPTHRPHTTGPGGKTRPKPGACPKGRGDLPADTLNKLSNGLITGGCEQLFADVLEDGQDCDTLVTDVIPDFPRAQGTLDMLCCDTCNKQVDPITSECEDNMDICKQDLDVFEEECQSCNTNNKATFNWSNCQECVAEVFGDELKICSCCLLPFLASADNLLPDDKIGYLFKCDDHGRQ